MIGDDQMKLEDLTPKQRLKAEKWLAIIRECINSDLSNEEWCEQNNVSIKSYYYYLAKLRKMATEQNLHYVMKKYTYHQ